MESPHGIPLDLLDRLLIIPTEPYSEDEVREIIRIRADEEEIPLTEESLDALTRIGVSKSLRYAVQLMEPAKIIARRKGRSKVDTDDVEDASKLFADTKTSLDLINAYSDKLLK
ncbi:MAG: RuvB-like domain-containing protein [Desulfurococcales archaeon]|nr:RuvB-like domain-containing protein [Desulfurococcales archaeon]